MKHSHVIYSMSNPSPGGEERRAMAMHPDDYFKSIGLTYEKAEPNSYQECWHLFGVEGLPSPTPSFFTIIKV